MPEYRDIETSNTVGLAVEERMPISMDSGVFTIDSRLVKTLGVTRGTIIDEIVKRAEFLRARLSLSMEGSNFLASDITVEWYTN